MKGNILEQITERTKSFEKHFGSFDNKKPIKEMSIRDMLGAMRKAAVNEDDAGTPRKVTPAEMDREYEKMLNYFQEDNVDIKFQDFAISPAAIFLSGSIDGQLLFSYTVTSEEKNGGVQVKYLDGFDPSDPDNDKIIKKVQAYYNDFYKYWRDNELQLN